MGREFGEIRVGGCSSVDMVNSTSIDADRSWLRPGAWNQLNGRPKGTRQRLMRGGVDRPADATRLQSRIDVDDMVPLARQYPLQAAKASAEVQDAERSAQGGSVLDLGKPHGNTRMVGSRFRSDTNGARGSA